MTKAVKCSACGLYYNGQVYDECPHCKAKQELGKETEKEVKQREPAVQEDVPAGKAEKGSKTEEDIGLRNQKRYTMPYNKAQTGTEHWEECPRPKEQEKKKLVILEEKEPLLDEAGGEEKKEKEKKPDPTPQTDYAEDLLKQLKKSGRTVGKFTSTDGDQVDPVVGWIVCVKGSYYGQSFALHSGKNKMGRSQEFDIRLLNDESVSRSCVAAIVFDTKMGAFSIIPGDSDSLCYVNGEALYERKTLVGYEQIELGDSERNMFVFVPLCGEQFSWNSYQTAK